MTGRNVCVSFPVLRYHFQVRSKVKEKRKTKTSNIATASISAKKGETDKTDNSVYNILLRKSGKEVGSGGHYLIGIKNNSKADACTLINTQ